MKKLFLIFTIAALSFAACSKDDKPDKFDFDKELLYGTWKITKIDGQDWPHEATTATFNSNGTYSGTGYFGNGTGTYKLSGKNVTCYVDGEKYMWYKVLTLSDQTCDLIASDDSASVSITCEKQ